MENSELIPFGKYRGRPIEDLASDPQYMEWLIQQPWFAQRHTNLYQIVINNFQEPSETPEHNAMQAKFLDENWRKKFLEAAGIERFSKITKEDPRIEEEKGLIIGWNEFNPDPQFEIDGIDVVLTGRYSNDPILIELKPSIGDDYPAVLRTALMGMKKKSKLRCFVVVDHFSSQVVSEDQFRAIFKASGIQVIFSREIESAEIKSIPPIPEAPVVTREQEMMHQICKQFSSAGKDLKRSKIVFSDLFNFTFVFDECDRDSFKRCSSGFYQQHLERVIKQLHPLSAFSFSIKTTEGGN